MEAQVFWFLAILACCLAFGFAIRHKSVLAANPRPVHLDLQQGQEQDNWLTSAVVWGAIFGEQTYAYETILIGGAFVLAWTAWRTLRRVTLLAR